VPIEHHRLVDLVRGTLSMFGHEIVEEHHAIDHNGMRYFGLMSLRSTYTGYRDTLGLRNSHDKSTPIGIAFGSQVFVCSNLAFIGDHVIRRRHTTNAERELPGLLIEIIEPLALQREQQAKTISRYRQTLLTDEQADHAILRMYRKGIIEFKETRSAWRLFNSATYALAGRVAERPDITKTLHQVINALCERVH
jgi:hypothetical protein